jgi:CRP/FNR family cyclic AMP-dependent transcriptional regulator
LAKPQARKPSSEDLSRYAATAKAGEFIFREGDLTSDLYILEDGRVELLRQHEGVPHVVATLGPGEPFGELALLEDAPRDLSARAVTDCALLKLDYATLIDVIRENPQVALHSLRRLSRRLKDRELAVLTAAAAPATPQPKSAAEVFSAIESGATPAAAPRKLTSPRLVHLKSGTAFPFATAEAVIGRGDKTHGTTVEIDLSDLDRQRTTSRRHAVVFMRGDDAFLREEPGVSNGTFVNGRRVKSGADNALQEGDRVRFGLVELVVRGSE